MATTTTASIDLKVAWTKRQTNSDSSVLVTDIGQYRANETMTYGVRTQMVDCIWHLDSVTLGSGESHDWDLYSLPITVLGVEGTISFSGGIIKGIVVQNLSEDNGASISICATGATPFTGPWNGGSGGNDIGALCQLPLVNITDGFEGLSDTAHVISIDDNKGSGVEYSICVFGVTGVGPYS